MNLLAPMKRLVIYRRLIELFLPCIVFSAIITIMNITGLVVQRNSVIIMISICVIIFTVFNFFNLRNCYFDMRNKKLFFSLNILSHFIFAVANLIFYAFAPNVVYTWMFSITKVLTFIDMNTIYSVLGFHFIGLVTVFTAPIGMGWIFKDEEYMYENTK